jgi:hypothetical protein
LPIPSNLEKLDKLIYEIVKVLYEDTAEVLKTIPEPRNESDVRAVYLTSSSYFATKYFREVNDAVEQLVEVAKEKGLIPK